MSIKSRTTYTTELDGHIFPIPFEYIEGSEVLQINGETARLGVLVCDESSPDPFEEFDEGEFYQFNSRYAHFIEKPNMDEFVQIVLDNPGRVVAIEKIGNSYKADRLIVEHRAGWLSDLVDGYYIAPKDVTDPANYAKGVLEEYSTWCQGEVFGVCVWEYRRAGEEWELTSRDNECWGYYGYSYAEQTLKEQMEEQNEGK
jgi:hypothetical protein